jgi:hypothetical protein
LLSVLKTADPAAWDTDNWRRNPRNNPMRIKLNQKGAFLVYNYPEFKNLWENVLSQEFLPPEEAGE